MMSRRLSLQDEVRYVKNVGPKRAKAFESLGITTVQELLDYVPFRIDDFSQVRELRYLKAGEKVTVTGRVISAVVIPSLRGKALRVEISDGTGTCYLVWYNMLYLMRRFRPGLRIVAAGRVEWRRYSWEIAHPLWEQRDDESTKGSVVPIYHGKANLNSSTIARIVAHALSAYGFLIKESLTEEITQCHGLLSQKQAYAALHRPSSAAMWEKAKTTFAFREALFLQLALMLMKNQNEKAEPLAPCLEFELADKFVDSLPFELTQAQKRTISEIKADLCSGRTMNRLIQGDVGSGKTVVAIWSLLAAVDNGYQGALLAPTEILAKQHLNTVQELTQGSVQIGFLSGSQNPRDKQVSLTSLAQGTIDILVGTHAMIEPNVKWARLGLVVTDEQHRFGVKQRLTLSYDTKAPHMLVMSATPIPRTLAITLFGDLDLSVIDEIPEGRKPVYTQVLGQSSRSRAYDKLLKELSMGYQAYVVCPLIHEGKSQRPSVEEVFRELKNSYLKNTRIGLAHGDMPKDKLAREMQNFAHGTTQVLVSTTVIEVGIDVKNASCMVIEGAESFGLATLHQLRGRVGRGDKQSYCFMVTSSESLESTARLRALENIHDGFSIAELDLCQRGPGQFFGLKQHGVGDIDMEALGITEEILYSARLAARKVLKKIEDDGQATPELSQLCDEINSRFGNLFRHARSR